MIRKGAVRAFLRRPRRDCRRWKRVPEVELDRRAARLPVVPPIWRKLQRHQKVCFLLGALARRFFFLNDTGTGKTLLIIALVRYFYRLGVIDRVLILVPNLINKGEWVEQIQMHSPKSTYTVLSGSSVEKWQALEDSDSLFVIETYAGLMKMVCTKIKNKKGKTKLAPDKKLLKRLASLVQGLTCDESFSIQNRGALPFRICNALASTIKICFTMTGTPFNRDPSSLWTQMYMIDRGETLGETLGLFRAAFFHQVSDGGWGVKYKFDAHKEKLLHQILANRSIEYEADSSTLPAVVPITKKVYLPEEAGLYYKRAVQTIIEANGNIREMKNAFIRMRQISSGFVGYYDDEAGEKAQFEFDDNPKLDLLLATVESINPKYKIIIFTEFNWSGERIARELKDRGIGCVHVYGKTKDASRARDRFKFDRDVQVMVLQSAMSYGLNVQVAKYGLYYESPVSAILRKQSRRRVERQYSAHKSVFIYDFVCAGTADEKILAFHKEGGDLFNAIVRGKVRARDLLQT
jgi:SNF2 family DNA or RNA helicase